MLEACASFLTRGASSRVETGLSGNFLSCSKGVKDPLEVPVVRCDYPRDASAEMGLISPGGETITMDGGPASSLSLSEAVSREEGTSGQFLMQLVLKDARTVRSNPTGSAHINA